MAAIIFLWNRCPTLLPNKRTLLKHKLTDTAEVANSPALLATTALLFFPKADTPVRTAAIVRGCAAAPPGRPLSIANEVSGQAEFSVNSTLLILDKCNAWQPLDETKNTLHQVIISCATVTPNQIISINLKWK